jgi:hypothetical protein
MHATRTKLAEASFFFGKLEAAGGKVFSPEPEAFAFYLSAFVSAGRSVTFALQAEHKQEYDEWFPNWRASLSDERHALLGHFNGLRVDAVHKLGVELSLQLVEIPMHEFLWAAARDGADIQIWHPPGTPAPPQHKVVRTFVVGGNEHDVLAACRFYLELLSDAIESFTRTYPAAAA